MKSIIIKCLLFSCFLFISLISVSQKTFRYIPLRGFNDEPLIRVDSLSFLDKNLSSEYYVDSLTHKAYTGKIKIDYNGNAYDYFNLIDGLKDGWQYSYIKNNNKLLLDYICFYDQSNLIYISNKIQSDKYKTSSFIKSGSFSRNNNPYFFEIKYKKSKKIIVLLKYTTIKKIKASYYSKISRTRSKFKDVVELEVFFKNHYEDIYQNCKKSWYFW